MGHLWVNQAHAFYLVLNRSTQNKGFTGNKEIDIHIKTSRQTKYPINKIKFSSGSHVSVTRVRNRIQLSDPASPSGNGYRCVVVVTHGYPNSKQWYIHCLEFDGYRESRVLFGPRIPRISEVYSQSQNIFPGTPLVVVTGNNIKSRNHQVQPLL